MYYTAVRVISSQLNNLIQSKKLNDIILPESE